MRRLLFLALCFIAGSVHAAQHRAFSITAHQFTYDVNPAPFIVEAGDTVTLTITASDDGTDGSGHGFFLEQYAEDLNVVHPGTTRTIEFVATVPGTFTYFCTSVCGSGHETMAGTFTVRESATVPPAIASFSPTRGPATGGTTVTITGSGFQTGATVLFGSELGKNVNVATPERITVVTPAEDAGSVTVTVVNPDQKSGTSAQLFTFESATPMSITSVSPNSGSTAGGLDFIVTGAGFVNGATVEIGGVSALNPIFINATTVRATTPLGPLDIDTPTPRDVTVTNPDGRVARLSAGFTWLMPPLAISSIAPDHGPATGGTRVTIMGAGITTAIPITVLIGGVAATHVEILDPITLTAATPGGAGEADVVLRRGTETATLAKGFQYEGAPKRRAVKK